MKEVELRISRLLQRVFPKRKKVTSNWSIGKQTNNRVALLMGDNRRTALTDAIVSLSSRSMSDSLLHFAIIVFNLFERFAAR